MWYQNSFCYCFVQQWQIAIQRIMGVIISCLLVVIELKWANTKQNLMFTWFSVFLFEWNEFNVFKFRNQQQSIFLDWSATKPAQSIISLHVICFPFKMLLLTLFTEPIDRYILILYFIIPYHPFLMCFRF